MKLILDLPVDFVADIIGGWLSHLYYVCNLEVAMCSAKNRVSLGPIYEGLVLESHIMEDTADMEKQIDWFLIRRIRLSSFQILYPLPRSAFSKVAAVLKHSGPQLHSLDVEENEELVNAIGATVSQYCTHVKSLKVGVMKLGAPAFAMLASLHFVKDLIILDCTFSVDAASCYLCPSVTGLCLHGDLSIEAQKTVLRMCPKLVSYTVCPGKNYVDLADLPLTVETFSALQCSFAGNLKANLEKLSLYACTITDAAVANILVSSPHLKELTIVNGRLTDISMREIGDKYGRCLQVLSLSKCGPFTSEGVSYLLERCTALTSLSWKGLKQPHSLSIIAALKECSYLRVLDINGAAVTDEILVKIAAAPSLETLSMATAMGYTEIGLMALIKGCTSLQHVSISKIFVTPLVKLLWQDMRPQLQINVSTF